MTDQTISLQPGDTLTVTSAAAAPAPNPTPGPAPDVTVLESAIDAAVSAAIADWQSPTPAAVPPALAVVPDLTTPPAFTPNT